MKSYIVRFKGTPPNHYDAPAPRLVMAENKECAGKVAAKLWPSQVVSSIRQNFGNFEPVQS